VGRVGEASLDDDLEVDENVTACLKGVEPVAVRVKRRLGPVIAEYEAINGGMRGPGRLGCFWQTNTIS